MLEPNTWRHRNINAPGPRGGAVVLLAGETPFESEDEELTVTESHVTSSRTRMPVKKQEGHET